MLMEQRHRRTIMFDETVITAWHTSTEFANGMP